MATAPPTVTFGCPGNTGGKRPRDTANSSRFPILTPGSRRTVLLCSSNARRRLNCLDDTLAPWLEALAKQYVKPAPRLITAGAEKAVNSCLYRSGLDRYAWTQIGRASCRERV